MLDRKLKIFKGQPLSLNHAPGSLERNLEDLNLRGYTTISPDEKINLEMFRGEVDRLYKVELDNYGENNLNSINDLGVVRNPFLNSKVTRDIFFDKKSLLLLKSIFGDQYILHVNRFVVSDPDKEHPASAWHREPPYNNFIAQSPLALTLIFMPDGSNGENNGVSVIPGSHLWPNFPSDDYANNNEITPFVNEGEILVIDSNLFHRTGRAGNKKRRSMVTIYTTPTIKQQTNIASVISNKYPSILTEYENAYRFYGVDTNPFATDGEYRNRKLNELGVR
jgi:hypothetical protein